MQTVFYYLLLGGLFFLMMRFGCGAHIMGHAHGHGHRNDDAKPDSSSPVDRIGGTNPAKETDPVCGMTIDTAGSKSSVFDGHVYHFCSQDCRDKFEAAPKSYMGGAASSPHSIEQIDEHQH